MIIELHRTPTALAGVMRSTGLTAGGHRCPVEYGLSVTVCKPGSLQVVSEISVPIDESCKRLRETADGGSDGGEVPSTLAEYLWERPDAGT